MSKADKSSDIAFIEALAEVLRKNELSEVEVKREYGEDDVLNVRVARQMAAPAPVAAAPVQMQAAPAPAQAPAPAAEASAPAAASSGDPASDPNAVPSPMVGTAYLAPEPGASNFVSVGDQVSEGQSLLIIEAMKTMNQIPSPKSGTVKRILVEDKTAVEYGQPLMIIE